MCSDARSNTCGYVCNSRVSAANFEIDQLIQPPGGSPPRGEKDRPRMWPQGRHLSFGEPALGEFVSRDTAEDGNEVDGSLRLEAIQHKRDLRES